MESDIVVPFQTRALNILHCNIGEMYLTGAVITLAEKDLIQCHGG